MVSDLREKIRRGKRLGDKPLGAGFCRCAALVRLEETRQQHDWNPGRARVGAQAAADIDAADTREEEVQKNEVWQRFSHRLNGTRAVDGLQDVIARRFQRGANEEADGWFVVDNEHRRLSLCRRFRPAAFSECRSDGSVAHRGIPF